MAAAGSTAPMRSMPSPVKTTAVSKSPAAAAAA
jgi:hypothetical protein